MSTTRKNEIAFVDTKLENYQSLIDGLSPGTEVILISSGNGLQQMADALDGRSNLDAIHIFSHGSAGALQLGSTTLNNTNLNSYAPLLTQIGQSLTPEGDLLLYGCNAAQGDAGQAFIEQIAVLTGADVAGSVDSTGAASLGGNWALEYNTGVLESSPIIFQHFGGLLPAFPISGGTQNVGTTTITGDQSLVGDSKWQIVIDSNPNGFAIKAGSDDVTGGWTHGTTITGGVWNLTIPSNQVAGSYSVLWTTTNSGVDGTLGTGDDVVYNTNFSFTLVSPNRAPVAGNGGVFYFNEGTSGSISLNNGNTGSSDPDGDSLSYTSPNYNIPTNTALKGNVFVTSAGYTVTDTGGLTANGSVSIYGTYFDDPTSWGSPPANQTWAASGTNSYNWASGASDPDDLVTYSYLSGAPVWMSTGTTLSGNVAPQYAGQSYTINVRASGSTSQDRSFSITIGDASSVNDLPTSAGGSKSVAEDGSVAFASGDFNFADLDNSAGGSTANGAALASIKIASLPTNGTLKLSGVDVTQNQVIATADIANLVFHPTANYNGSDSFTYSVNDGIADSVGTATMSLTVTPVNDAPVLSGTGSDMTGITENATADAGQLVSTILATQTDTDTTIGSAIHGSNNGLLQGIAIYSTTVNGPSTGGKWQYKVDAGSWTDIGAVAEGSALLLKSTDMVRFVPDGKNGQTASFDYYAWDQSAGTSAGSKVNVSTRGTTTPYSTDSDSVAITIDDVNDAPTISTPSAKTVLEDNTLTITDLSFDDVDINTTWRNDSDTTNNVVEVTLSVAHGTLALSGTTGITFQDSTAQGQATIKFQGTLVDVNAAVDGLQYTPDQDYNRYLGVTDAPDVLNISISDLGNVRGTGDAGAAALTATSSFNITVNPVNDAPILQNAGTSAPVLTTITENVGNDNGSADADANAATLNDGDDDATLNTNNGGDLISDLIRAVDGTTDATGFTSKSFGSDVDFFTGGTSNGSPNEGQDHGIAVYGLSNTGPADGGTWQYSTNGGTSWTNITTANMTGNVDTATALLLRSTDKIRFVPDTNNGTTATISYVLWDGGGLVGNTTNQQGTYTSIATRGGTTNFSTGTDQATITVTHVNDNPVLDLDGSDDSSVSTGFTTSFLPRGTAVQVVDSDVTITDVDKAHRTDVAQRDTITQATLTIATGALDNLFGTTYETLTAKTSATGSAITSYTGSLGSLSITGNGTATVTINGTGTWADYQNALRTVYYYNSNENATVGTRTVTVVVKDGGDTTAADDKLDSNIATTTINMPWAPVVDLDGSLSSGRNHTTTFTEGVGGANGTAVAIAYSNAGITDQDGNIASVTVALTNHPDGGSESLNVDASLVTTLTGLGITTTGNGSHSITFSGNADSTYFQLALRSVKYLNTSQNPDVTQRVVTVSALDVSSNPSVSAQTTINITPVNDAPVIGDGDRAATLLEGALYTLTAPGDLNPSDVDDSAASLKYMVTTVPANGTLFRDANYNNEADSGEILAATAGAGVITSFLQADVSAGMIKYRHNSSNTTSDSFAYRLEDGLEDGITAPTSTFSFTVTPVNDAPTLTATATNPTFTEGGAVAALFSAASTGTDETGQNITQVKLTVSGLADGAAEKMTVDGTTFALTNATGGNTTANTVGYSVAVAGSTATVTLTKIDSTTNWNTILTSIGYSNTSTAPTTTPRVVTLTEIKDDGGTANGGVDTSALSLTSTVTLSGINNAPTGLPVITGTVAQGQTLTSDTSGIADADGLGTFAYQWQASTNGTIWTAITGATASTYVLTAADIGKYVRVNVTYTDGGGTLESLNSWQAGAPDSSTNGTAVVDTNDAPTLTATGANPTAINGSAALFTAATASTIETGQLLAQLTLTVSGLADGVNEKLKIDGQTIALTDSTSGTTLAGSVGYSVAVVGTTATVTLTHAGLTTAQVKTLIEGLAYQNDAIAPSAGSRVVTLTSLTDDGVGTTGGTATGTVSLSSTVVIATAANTAPTVSGDLSFTVNEGGSYTVLAADMAASDSQTPAASLQLILGTAPANGTLYNDVNGNSIIDGGEALVNGASFLQSALTAGQIKYRHNGSETTNDSFTFTASDNSLSSTPASTVTVNITPVNDAPTLVATGANPGAIDGTAALFTAATASTIEAGQLLTQLTLTVSGLADGADEKLKINGVLVDLQDIATTEIAGGTKAGASYAITGTAGGTATVTITHAGLTGAETKTLIEGLAYQNSAGTPTNGMRVVTLTGLTDNGGGTETTAVSITSSVNITTGSGGATINTTPTIGTNTGLTLNEDAVHTVLATELAATDTEQPAASLVFTVGTAPTNGTLFRDANGNGAVDTGEALAAAASFTQLELTSGLIKYRHSGSETKTDTLTLTASDGSLASNPASTVTVTVTPVNDAPTLAATGLNPAAVDGNSALFGSVAASTIETGAAHLVTQLTLTVAGLVDGANEKLKIDGVAIALQNAATTAVVGGTQDGVSYAIAVNSGTATVTLTHTGLTEAQAKTLIEALAYVNSAAAPSNGIRTVTLTGITDTDGITPVTTATSISSSVDVGAATLNTAPTVSANTGLTFNEGVVHTLLAGELAATDTQQPAGSLIFTVGAKPTKGTLFIDANSNNVVETGEALDNAGTFLQSQLTGGLLKYKHDGSESTTDSFTFTVGDGLLATNPAATFNITVNPANDAPTLTATGANPTFTEGGTAATLFSISAISAVETENIKALTLTVSNVADTTESLGIDGSTVNLTHGATNTTATNGMTYSVSLSGTTATVTLTKVAGISSNAMQALVNGITYSNSSTAPSTGNARVVTLTSIQDVGGTANGGVDTTAVNVVSTVTLVPVNTAPTLSAAGFTVTEGGSYTLGTIQIAAADVDSQPSSFVYELSTAPTAGTVYVDANSNAQLDTGEALAVNGTFTQAQLTGGKVRYQHDANETDDSFAIKVSDGSLPSSAQTLTVARTPVNDAPKLNALDTDVKTYPANSGLQTVDVGNDANVTDPDSSDFNGGVLRVSISLNNDGAHDVLAIQNVGTAAGQIGVSGSNVTYAGTTIGTWAGGTGANDLVITFNSAAAMPAAASALLKAIQFSNDQASPALNSRAITFSLSDGDGGLSQAVTVNVNIPTNTQPIILNGSGFYIAENTTAVTTISATDPNNRPVTFSVSGGADAAKFSIDGSTGALRFVAGPDFENPTDAGLDNVYNVTVRATNDQSAYNESALVVNVVNVVDEAAQANSNDTTPPAFGYATVNGTTLTMQYNDASNLDATNIAATGAFTVSGNTVTNVAVSAASKTVTLTLGTAVAYGQNITVAYTDPTVGNDVNAIQDAAGNDAASLAATAVTNLAAAPPAPPAGGGGGGGGTPPPVTPPPVTPPPVTPPTESPVPPAVEDQVPGLPPAGGGTPVAGDGNGDGVSDSQQLSVASLPFLNTSTPISNPGNAAPVYLTLVADSREGITDTTDSNSAQLTSIRQLDAPSTLPSSMFMPLGMLSFEADIEQSGITETFSMFVDSSVAVNGYWVQNREGIWQNLATKIETVGGKIRIDFVITDGGAFDVDGQSNGQIGITGAVGAMPLSIVGTVTTAPGTGFWF